MITCSGFELMPYFGVRALFLNQRDFNRFTGIALLLTGDVFADVVGSTRIEEELWSVGPRLGVQASWGRLVWVFFVREYLRSNFSMEGLRKYVSNNKYSTFWYFGSGPPGYPFGNTYTQDRYNVIVPNLQVQLGFGYKMDFDLGCSPCCLDIYALWEGNTYWNASNVLLQERKLGLNGLTTGFSFGW